MRTRFMLLLAMSALAARATEISIDPLRGFISGAPGDSIGWGFTVSADPTDWISFVTSFPIHESNPSIGAYSDFIGAEGGPTNFVLAPGAASWIQSFDSVAQTGLGVYAIDPNAPIGSTDSGDIRILYAAYSGDPNVCFVCTPTEGSFDVPFQVFVSAPAPEPAAYLSIGVGLLLISLQKRRFRRRGPGGRTILAAKAENVCTALKPLRLQ
jgi:hypothetical protein